MYEDAANAVTDIVTKCVLFVHLPARVHFTPSALQKPKTDAEQPWTFCHRRFLTCKLPILNPPPYHVSGEVGRIFTLPAHSKSENEPPTSGIRNLMGTKATEIGERASAAGRMYPRLKTES